MPTLDGLEILRRLQRDGIHVPVVLLSAFTQPEIVDQALTAGAAGYLSKDAPRDEILAALEAAAARPRTERRRLSRHWCPPSARCCNCCDDGWTVERASRSHRARRRHDRAAPARRGGQARHPPDRRHALARARARAPGLRPPCSSCSSATAPSSSSRRARGTDLPALPQHRRLAPPRALPLSLAVLRPRRPLAARATRRMPRLRARRSPDRSTGPRITSRWETPCTPDDTFMWKEPCGSDGPEFPGWRGRWRRSRVRGRGGWGGSRCR